MDIRLFHFILYEYDVLSQEKTIKDQANEIAKLKNLYYGSSSINEESVQEYQPNLKTPNKVKAEIKGVNNQSTIVRINLNRRQLQGMFHYTLGMKQND